MDNRKCAVCAGDLPPESLPQVPHGSQLAWLPCVCHFRVCSLSPSSNALWCLMEEEKTSAVLAWSPLPDRALLLFPVAMLKAKCLNLKLECCFLLLSVIS